MLTEWTGNCHEHFVRIVDKPQITTLLRAHERQIVKFQDFDALHKSLIQLLNVKDWNQLPYDLANHIGYCYNLTVAPRKLYLHTKVRDGNRKVFTILNKKKNLPSKVTSVELSGLPKVLVLNQPWMIEDFCCMLGKL